ncbi:cytochrome C [Rhodoferax sp.]|uniref:cytochrome C n=1 Tax=Rhodoferax sp. TaxID=50421 RepID=UPI0026385B67|nr:cytochrome C [Rhodoferax sp.]MDD2923785.1 cytochrome C [Rhodoferax sp.]
MSSSRLKVWFMAAAFFFWTSLPGGAAAADAPSPTGLGNASCLSCHDGQKGQLEVAGPDGEKRALLAVEPAGFAKSVHADMECVTCHLEINDSTAKHKKTLGEKRPDCVQCHLKLNDASVKEKVAGERRWMQAVGKSIETYQTSYHARPNADDPTKQNASCNDCHNVHSFNVPPPGTAERTDWHLGISDLCGKCHENQLDDWSKSVHGREIKQKHNPKAADCADCHTSHNVRKTASDKVKLAITANCGSCHDEAYVSYRATYHGKITTLGYAHTAKCFDCHSSHDIEPSSNSASKMHLNNRLESCQECHSGKKKVPLATAGFVSFSPHGTSNNFATDPEIWMASKVMISLLVGTFGFFWLHTLLWFYREYKERQRRQSQRHVNLEGLADAPVPHQGKHFRRFSRTWRIAHLLFALSLMTLTLTGIPLFYPQSPWAQPLMSLLNGPSTAGLIHRVAATIFAGVFFWHLVYMLVRIGRDWRNFKIFGPNSMVPGLQDLKDILAMFKWFFGKGPRPVFDRWTYWEKFDYWAPFWGVTIIGVSGIMMWFPHIAAQYLPGWVFNVAAIFHSEEAFLAVVFLFTVHFFNNHFRPDKFPLDRVMFTGTVTLEELRHEHPLQYQRLLDSGELEQHLVDAPSPAMVQAATVLGFVLIVAGLILLTLVGIGFFTSL